MKKRILFLSAMFLTTVISVAAIDPHSVVHTPNPCQMWENTYDKKDFPKKIKQTPQAHICSQALNFSLNELVRLPENKSPYSLHIHQKDMLNMSYFLLKGLLQKDQRIVIRTKYMSRSPLKVAHLEQLASQGKLILYVDSDDLSTYDLKKLAQQPLEMHIDLKALQPHYFRLLEIIQAYQKSHQQPLHLYSTQDPFPEFKMEKLKSYQIRIHQDSLI